VCEVLRLRAPVDAQNDSGESSLHLAVYSGHILIADQLLDKGADINLTNNDGETPLFYAARKSNAAIIRLLLQRGMNACLLSCSHFHLQIDSVALLCLSSAFFASHRFDICYFLESAWQSRWKRIARWMRFAISLELLCNRIGSALQSTCNRFAVTLEAHCNRVGSALQSLGRALQSTCNCFGSALQSR
jgi:ankyrin repeat protein